jgi:hypothetical protein
LTVQQVETIDLEKFVIRDIKLPQLITEGRYPVNQATVISMAALDEIKQLLRNKLLDDADDYGVAPISDKALKGIMDEIGTEWTTKHGNWPKRFAKVFKHQRRQKFSSDFLSQVGKIARESCVMSTGKELIITKDFDWNPGIYGDSNSCYWGCRSGAKKILEMANAFALLIHGEHNYPLGRAWCIPYDSHYIIFNAYAIGGQSITIVTFARILSDVFNYPYYRNIELTCRDTEEGPLWINNRKGYIIGSQEVADIEDVDLDYALYCDGCGEECTYEAYLEPNGVFCDGCAKGSQECECCEGRVHEDEVYWVHDCAVCPTCFERDAYSCYSCGRNDWNDNSFEYEGEPYCEYCVDKYFEKCDQCDELVHSEDMVGVSGDAGYCRDCARVYTHTCKECGTHFDIEIEKDDSKSELCNECYHASQIKLFKCEDCENWCDGRKEIVGEKENVCNACYYTRHPEERPSELQSEGTA